MSCVLLLLSLLLLHEWGRLIDNPDTSHFQVLCNIIAILSFYYYYRDNTVFYGTTRVEFNVIACQASPFPSRPPDYQALPPVSFDLLLIAKPGSRPGHGPPGQ